MWRDVRGETQWWQDDGDEGMMEGVKDKTERWRDSDGGLPFVSPLVGQVGEGLPC